MNPIPGNGRVESGNNEPGMDVHATSLASLSLIGSRSLSSSAMERISDFSLRAIAS